MKKITKKKIEAEKFDEAFEDGRAVEHLDRQSAKLDVPIQRINIDIPRDILEKVDREAERIGVARTSLIKLWIAGHVDRLAG